MGKKGGFYKKSEFPFLSNFQPVFSGINAFVPAA